MITKGDALRIQYSFAITESSIEFNYCLYRTPLLKLPRGSIMPNRQPLQAYLGESNALWPLVVVKLSKTSCVHVFKSRQCSHCALEHSLRDARLASRRSDPTISLTVDSAYFLHLYIACCTYWNDMQDGVSSCFVRPSCHLCIVYTSLLRLTVSECVVCCANMIASFYPL